MLLLSKLLRNLASGKRGTKRQAKGWMRCCKSIQTNWRQRRKRIRASEARGSSRWRGSSCTLASGRKLISDN